MKKNKLGNIILLLFLFILIGVFAVAYMQDKKNTTDNNSQVQEETNTDSKEEENNSNSSNTDLEKDRFEELTLTNEDIGIPVLYYHSVEEVERNEVVISPEKLRKELQYIKDSGYVTLTMSEVNDYINNNKPIPEKSILITFDDGYMNNYTDAFPILKELDMKATIFVIANGLDDGYYLSSEQLKELSDYGIDIESHTFTHPHLNELTYEQQLEELVKSKEKIEGITGKPVLSVAYPFGDIDENSAKAAKAAGYSLAFTTDLGRADRTDGNLNLNRVYVSSSYTMDQFKTILNSLKK